MGAAILTPLGSFDMEPSFLNKIIKQRIALLACRNGENYMADRKPGYDLKSLSKMLNLGVVTLRKYIRRGDLKAKKIGKSYYVTDNNLMKFLEPEK